MVSWTVTSLNSPIVMKFCTKLERRGALLPYFKLCASFLSHLWFQTGVTIWKWMNCFFTSAVTLTFTFCMDITSVNGNDSWKFHDDTMVGTWWKRCDGRTDWTIHRAAWSQLKTRYRPKPFNPGAEFENYFPCQRYRSHLVLRSGLCRVLQIRHGKAIHLTLFDEEITWNLLANLTAFIYCIFKQFGDSSQVHVQQCSIVMLCKHGVSPRMSMMMPGWWQLSQAGDTCARCGCSEDEKTGRCQMGL